MYYIDKNYNHDNQEYDKKINESLEELFGVEDVEYLDGDSLVPELRMHPRYIEELRNKSKITISKIDLDRFGCVNCKNIYKFDRTKKIGKLVDKYTCQECGKSFEVCDNKLIIEYNLVKLLCERINYVNNYYYGEEKEKRRGVYQIFLEKALEKLSEVNKELEAVNKELPKIEPHPKKYIEEPDYPFKELVEKKYSWLKPQEDLPKIEPRSKVYIIKTRLKREDRDFYLRIGYINLFQYHNNITDPDWSFRM